MLPPVTSPRYISLLHLYVASHRLVDHLTLPGRRWRVPIPDSLPASWLFACAHSCPSNAPSVSLYCCFWQDESLATVGIKDGDCPGPFSPSAAGETPPSLRHATTATAATTSSTCGGTAAPPQPPKEAATHRLCPSYASDISSPLRHVRTRIYATSESHIHSLVNVLRYAHLPAQQPTTAVTASSGGSGGAAAAVASGIPPNNTAAEQDQGRDAGGGSSSAAALFGRASSSGYYSTVASACAEAPAGRCSTLPLSGSCGRGPDDSSDAEVAGVVAAGLPAAPLLSAEGMAALDAVEEFDYLTHIVFRCSSVPQPRPLANPEP